MVVDHTIYELIAAYLNGEASDADRKKVEDWINESNANKKVFEDCKIIWESAERKIIYHNTDSALLLEKLRQGMQENRNSPARVVALISRKSTFWEIAACITIVFLAYVVVRLLQNDRITITSKDQVATIILPDSSKVWLNVNSELSYSKDFKDRTITLQGEAFFSVTKNKGRFTVITENSTTQVVGTAFNLKEESNNLVTLTVAEGKVNFSNNGVNQEKILVIAGEKASLAKSSHLAKIKNDNPLFAAWRSDNNNLVEFERKNPMAYLTNDYAWRKNGINQSVITGTIVNRASLCAYDKIVLSVVYTRKDNSTKEIEVILREKISPGEKLPYRKALLDILSTAKSIEVNIKSAEVSQD